MNSKLTPIRDDLLDESEGLCPLGVKEGVPVPVSQIRSAHPAKELTQRFILFSLAMEARVGIFMGQTSTQDSDLEQVFPKCSA